MMNRFTIDGKVGEDASLEAGPGVTGTVDIAVSDTAMHYLIVFCPTLADGSAHVSRVDLRPQGLSSPTASFSVNDPTRGGDNHIFQFVFTGNVTLSITTPSTGTFPIRLTVLCKLSSSTE